MSCSVTIMDVLRERSQGFLSDSSLQLICMDMGQVPDDEFYYLEEKDRDLLLGNMYFYMYGSSTGGSTEKVADGGWSHSESRQVSNNDINRWARLHRQLYAKWGLEPLIPFSGVQLKNY